MLTRRRFLLGTAAAAGWTAGCEQTGSDSVRGQRRPRPAQPDRGPGRPVARAKRRPERDRGRAGRGAGGQHRRRPPRDGRAAVRRPHRLLDTRALSRVLALRRRSAASLEVEAGIQWPALIDLPARGAARPAARLGHRPEADRRRPPDHRRRAGRQHPRPGPALRPIVGDVESFVLVDADGEARRVQPDGEPRALPARHRRLRALRRDHLGHAAARAAAQARARGRGASTSTSSSTAFAAAHRRRLPLRRLPVRHRPGLATTSSATASSPATARSTTDADAADAAASCRPRTGTRLLYLSHADKRRAFEDYAAYYLATSGQLYWSDTHQLGVYVDDYHRGARPAARRDGARHRDDHRALRAAAALCPRSWPTCARTSGRTPST